MLTNAKLDCILMKPKVCIGLIFFYAIRQYSPKKQIPRRGVIENFDCKGRWWCRIFRKCSTTKTGSRAPNPAPAVENARPCKKEVRSCKAKTCCPLSYNFALVVHRVYSLLRKQSLSPILLGYIRKSRKNDRITEKYSSTRIDFE